MGVHIQVRDVPDSVFLALKARAADSGQSLSEFLCGMFEQVVASVPTPARSTAEHVAGVLAPRSWRDQPSVAVSD